MTSFRSERLGSCVPSTRVAAAAANWVVTGRAESILCRPQWQQGYRTEGMSDEKRWCVSRVARVGDDLEKGLRTAAGGRLSSRTRSRSRSARVDCCQSPVRQDRYVLSCSFVLWLVQAMCGEKGGSSLFGTWRHADVMRAGALITQETCASGNHAGYGLAEREVVLVVASSAHLRMNSSSIARPRPCSHNVHSTGLLDEHVHL